ncbi:MAG TPA: RHS repeat-associated core domain-containing protein, partial [Gemmatimonadaceae bacterium]
EIDRPLGVIDSRVAGYLRVPHPTWRGMYESSSTASGAPADCSLTTNTCTLVAWNATNSLYKLDAPGDTHVTYTYTWVGGLLMNQQDASGLLYRRNRYYDPMSGRFSQEDPIGLGGGLNTYGFAGGDPVNYQDPLGLCPPCPETAGAGGAAGAAGLLTGLTTWASSTAKDVAAAIDQAAESVREKLRPPEVQNHHIATDKNGYWTPIFQKMFDKAGMSLQDPANIVPVEGHIGPHSDVYHMTVQGALLQATQGKSGAAYRTALQGALFLLSVQASTPGTPLNTMITKRGDP